MKVEIIPTIVSGTLISRFTRAAEVVYHANYFSKLELKPTPNPNEWSFKITLPDLRVWEQTFLVTAGVWSVKFNVVNFWNPLEYLDLIPLRAAMQELMDAGVTNIKIDN